MRYGGTLLGMQLMPQWWNLRVPLPQRWHGFLGWVPPWAL